MPKIVVTKLTPGDKTGTPESFEQQFEKRRSKGSGRVTKPSVGKLRPIENKSMSDRLEQYGIEEI
jgi:hypothetical protein